MSVSLEAWWAAGTVAPLQVAGADVEVFVWDSGRDPHDRSARTITLLHGWPTSSWDWSRVAPALARGARVVAPDLLGLGRSSKGDDVPYDIRAQADMVVALWERSDITSTDVVAHDVGTIVTQELLARQLEGRVPVRIDAVTWLNGSLDPSRYQPTPGQLALLDPEHGPALAVLVDGAVFADALAGVHVQRPTDDELAQHWSAMSRDDGHLGSPRFLRYIPDRAADAARLLGAFRDATIPMRLVWGLDDPVSGRTQLEAIRAVRPDVPVLELEDTGHSPHTEQPDAVASYLVATHAATARTD